MPPPSLRSLGTDYEFSRLQLGVHDRRPSTSLDQLPEHVEMVMGLNELAVRSGQGFFFFLPRRESFSKPPTTTPKGRAMDISGFDGNLWWTIVFMRFAWDTALQAAFWASSQRERYLKCSFQLNPPPAPTPLYAINSPDWNKKPIESANRDSLVLMVVKEEPKVFYVAKAVDIGNVLGRDKGGKVDTAAYVFRKDLCISPEQGKKREAMQRYRLESLQNVYEQIVRICQPGTGGIRSSFSAKELLSVQPQATSLQEAGHPLGSQVEGIAVGRHVPASSKSRTSKQNRGGGKGSKTTRRGRGQRSSDISMLDAE